MSSFVIARAQMERNPSSSIREIEEEEEEEEEREERVYVAVKKEFKEGKPTLIWLLQNSHDDNFMKKKKLKIVITHVHIPSQTIPMMGSKLPVSKVAEQVVKAHRQQEREKMQKDLDDYIALCSKVKVQAEKLVIEAGDVAKGLIELISLHGIINLVMGAAADKHFSRKMEVPRSTTAITVKQKADPSCRIWFVCKGTLICTREAFLDSSGGTPSPASTLSSSSSQSDQLRSRSLPQFQAETLSSNDDQVHDLSRHRTRSDNFNSHSLPFRALPHRSRFSSEISLTTDEDHSFCSVTDEILSSSSSLSTVKYEANEEGSVMLNLVRDASEDCDFLSLQNELEDGLDIDVYDRLQEAHIEAENLKREAFEESLKRQRAERDAIDALRKAMIYKDLHVKEVHARKNIEESLAIEKLEVEMLKAQRDEIFEQLQTADNQKLELEHCIADSNSAVRDLEEKLLLAQHLLNTLKMENDDLQRKRDEALNDVEELRRNRELVAASSNGSTNFSEFSFSEIEIATSNFSDLLKIGEGGYGSVYKGFLRNTTAAIKVLDPQSTQGHSEFHQEVNVLSRVRHRNLVTLIGVCSESRALIYEFLPNGSLEDRLECKNNTPPLTWQARIRIALDICSALLFLHSNKPHPIVHGDLKPENILLDDNLIAKISDFGICRLLVQSTTSTLYHHTHPKGTLAYMDPEFLATGELTAKSDVYSFGIIILRILMGRPAFGIVKDMKEALDKGCLHELIDYTAGDWPFVQAKQLAHLGLRCCEISRRNRPDLSGEVWRVLEPMAKASSLSAPSVMDDSVTVPSYFICPIFQDIMRDPHIASDGFTYEAEALKGWIEGGHNTSPMTNIMLPHSELIPNRALRSAIQEWLQQHPQL